MFGKKKKEPGFFEKLKEDVRKAVAGGAREGAKVGVREAVRVGVKDAVKEGILEARGEVAPREDNLLSENEPEPPVTRRKEPV